MPTGPAARRRPRPRRRRRGARQHRPERRPERRSHSDGDGDGDGDSSHGKRRRGDRRRGRRFDRRRSGEFRRRNALYLLKACLEARLDGPYVDAVVAYHRAQRAHDEANAVRELGELLDLRPALGPELESWARLHAPLPPGMPVPEAVAILGRPTGVYGETGELVWGALPRCHVIVRLDLETRGDVVTRIEQRP